MLFFCPIWYPPDLSNFCSTRSCLIIAPPPLDEKLLVFTRGVNYQEPQKYFLGTKIPKYFFCFFFRFVFLLQKLVTFWDKKLKNIFFSKKIFSKIVKILFSFFVPKVTKFCSKKKKEKKYFYAKTILENIFLQKKCF
jgi:hypothetical protein